jgi:hypothetical protein
MTFVDGKKFVVTSVFLVVNIQKAAMSQSVYWLDRGLDDKGIVVQFPVGQEIGLSSKIFRSILEPMWPPILLFITYVGGGGGSYPGWSWPLASVWCRGKEWLQILTASPVCICNMHIRVDKRVDTRVDTRVVCCYKHLYPYSLNTERTRNTVIGQYSRFDLLRIRNMVN